MGKNGPHMPLGKWPPKPMRKMGLTGHRDFWENVWKAQKNILPA